ncbi:MAG: thiamine diphosphokinase [Ruminococcaceae bacterium]|nr:thiamine diphosphokinase [Oscillospiraceae bacterium]
MACYIFGAGDFFGLAGEPGPDDWLIAADGGWSVCRQLGLTPNLLIGDFDSLEEVPDFPHIRRVPVEKDDTDMMLAVKEGLTAGERIFHLYGGMGGRRMDHTIANLQTLLYLARQGAQGWLYGRGERYTAICDGTITLPAQPAGILSVFCLGENARGVTISDAQYELKNAVLTADFPLGVSNHFVGRPITVSVERGGLLIGLREGT